MEQIVAFESMDLLNSMNRCYRRGFSRETVHQLQDHPLLSGKVQGCKLLGWFRTKYFVILLSYRQVSYAELAHVTIEHRVSGGVS